MYGLYDEKTDSLIKGSICHSMEGAKGYAAYKFNCSAEDLKIIGLLVVSVEISYITPNAPTNE